MIRAMVVVALVAGCGGSATTTPRPASSYVEEYGGGVTALEAILEETDCTALARTFDAAEANMEAFGDGTERSREQLGRMVAAGDRMEDLGCAQIGA